MGNKLIDVHVYGPLAEKYGEHHRFAINSPREAIAAMDANFPGFLADFAKHERYMVMVDGDWRGFEGAELSPIGKEVHFCPQVEGGSFLVPFIASAIATTFAVSMPVATLIGGLLITGLLVGVSLLFRPKAPEKPGKEKSTESFAFSGPENVTGQGVAVPLIYGRVYAGTVVVSAGQDTADVVTSTKKKANPKPSSPNTSKPSGQNPPFPWREHASPSPPLRLMAAGSGVTLLEEGDEDLIPPEEGWPDILPDPIYGWAPNKGWVITNEYRETEEEDEFRKTVLVWQPPYWTSEGTYCWNMQRGFYMDDVGLNPEEWEQIDGSQLEEPVENPSE